MSIYLFHYFTQWLSLPAGVYSELIGNQNILIAKYTKNLELVSRLMVTNTGDNYNSGYGIIKGEQNRILVSGFLTEIISGLDIWLSL